VHPPLAVDERGEGMVDRELVEERRLLVGPELDIGSLGTPVEAEFDGKDPMALVGQIGCDRS
jgi:hypothetical protein